MAVSSLAAGTGQALHEGAASPISGEKVGAVAKRDSVTCVYQNCLMTTLSSRSMIIAALASTLLLAGCAPTAPTTSTGGDTDPGTGSGTGAGGADCGIYAGQTDPELMLFTSTAIAAGPAEGQTYGDGSELSITLSQEAIDAGLLPQFELIKLTDNGGPELISSLAFDPTTGADGTYSTSSFEFGNDELVGTAVVAEFFAISDATVGDARPYGDKLLLGNYCMTYGNDG